MATCVVRRRKCYCFNVFACLWHSRSSASCHRVKTLLSYYYPPQMQFGDLDLWCYTRNQIIWHDWENARRRHNESNIKQQQKKTSKQINFVDLLLCQCCFRFVRIGWDFMLHVELINNNNDGDQSKANVRKCERVKGFIYHIFIYFSSSFPCQIIRAHATSTAKFIVLHFAHHRSSDVGRWARESADATYGYGWMNRISKIQLHATFRIDRISSDNWMKWSGVVFKTFKRRVG